jgi:hypothetical protein
MKPCHIAAFALVGWYLMVPPDNFDGLSLTGDYPEFHLPIAKWEIDESYDTAAECKEELRKNQRSNDPCSISIYGPA